MYTSTLGSLPHFFQEVKASGKVKVPQVPILLFTDNYYDNGMIQNTNKEKCQEKGSLDISS